LLARRRTPSGERPTSVVTSAKLTFPVTATNVVTGASGEYPIGYSEGTRRWLERSQWRHYGVQNIRVFVQ